MTSRRQGWKGWMVRLVALLFAVQGALLAVSQGAAADALRVDQFGNVLCLASGDTHDAASDGKDGGHADPATCCTLACAMFAAVAPSPAVAAWPTGKHETMAPAAFVSFADRLTRVAESPRVTRGPPGRV